MLFNNKKVLFENHNEGLIDTVFNFLIQQINNENKEYLIYYIYFLYDNNIKNFCEINIKSDEDMLIFVKKFKFQFNNILKKWFNKYIFNDYYYEEPLINYPLLKKINMKIESLALTICNNKFNLFIPLFIEKMKELNNIKPDYNYKEEFNSFILKYCERFDFYHKLKEQKEKQILNIFSNTTTFTNNGIITDI